jgi:hydrogenase/urease accessory protein HupE
MNRSALLRILVLLCALWGAAAVCAHESLPASLILNETTEHRFEVMWRVPQTQGQLLSVSPAFPDDCQELEPPQAQQVAGARLLQWRVQCQHGLRSDAQIAFTGLHLTMIDVLVRITYLDGNSEAQVARPRTPSVVLGAVQHQGLEVSAYFGLGVEHILSGIDHLLFVLCLMLLVPSVAGLLKTITAFTLAHSVTLALSALEIIHVPQPPVEATIALSILFLARELARKDAADGVAVRRPWAVAFVFGLLHGFGFAGALAEIGLPKEAISSALLLFNVGVETGQLMFVALVYPIVLLAQRWRSGWPRWTVPVPVYSVGAVSGFWFLQRIGPVLGV